MRSYSIQQVRVRPRVGVTHKDTLFSTPSFYDALKQFEYCVQHYGDELLVLKLHDKGESYNLRAYVPVLQNSIDTSHMRRLTAEHRLFAMFRNNTGWVRDLARNEIRNHAL